MSKTVVISAGGSGGHLFLAQKIGTSLKDSHRVVYMGVGLEENRFFRDRDSFVSVQGANFSQGILHGLKAIGRGCKESRTAFRRLHVDHVLGLGSFHSLPPLCTALYLGVPFSLVEPNVLPGKVNVLFSSFAENTFIQFSGAKKYLRGATKKVLLERREKRASKAAARAFFGLQEDLPTLLVFGGSQGAEAINTLLFASLERLPSPIQLLHFTGKEVQGLEKYKEKGIPAFVAPFCKEMDLAWAAADFAICRAGANSVAEHLAYEVPALFIPFPQATDDHQTKNAKYAEQIGGAFVEAQNQVTPEKIGALLYELFAGGKIEEKKRALELHKQEEESLLLIDAIKDIL